MRRLPPSRRIKQELEAALQGQETAEHPLDTFVRLGARLVLQAALEQEVEELLGRAHYQRDRAIPRPPAQE